MPKWLHRQLAKSTSKKGLKSKKNKERESARRYALASILGGKK